jgi:hypothetical protein
MARGRAARGPRRLPRGGGGPAFYSCYICDRSIQREPAERELDGVIVYLHRYHVARFEARQRAKAKAAELWKETCGGSR